MGIRTGAPKVIVLKVTEKGTFFGKESVFFSYQVQKQRRSKIKKAVEKEKPVYQAGITATILFILTTIAVR